MTEAAPAVGDVVYFEVWCPSNCGIGWTSNVSGTVVELDYEPDDDDRAEHAWRGEMFRRYRGPYMLVELADGRPWPVRVAEVSTQPPVAELIEAAADE